VSHAVTQIDPALIGKKCEKVFPKIIVHQTRKKVIMEQFAESSDLHCSFGAAPASYRYPNEARKPTDCAFNLGNEDVDGFDMITTEPR